MSGETNAGRTAGPAPFATPRMEALAQIAGGLAPPLNDLLTVIRGQAGLLLEGEGLDTAAQERLKRIHAAAERAGSLLRQLEIFSQQRTLHAKPMDLNTLLGETEGVIRRLLGEGIAVEFHLGPGLPLILADPDMLEQVLIILTLNACDAMPGGGRLLFRTEAVEGPAGKGAVLRVEDSGHGIAPEILPRLFEPFFTTKADRRGLGLGLATAFGILRLHGGGLAVESAAGGGAIFQATLPAAEAGPQAEPGQATAARPPSGNETILLVEDDEGVREFLVNVLKEQGYRVLQAGSGPDALEVWQWHAPRIRLLLTDMVLEDRMSGLELAARLRSEKPGLKVICSSGHPRESLERFPGLAGGYQFLPKPCRIQTLLATVRALLDEAPR